MRFFVGVTDYDWFTYLKAQQADEVNFWQPSGSSQFRALQPGEPFLFKLHSPRNVIAGGGYFSHFSLSPLSFAWYAFQQKNGAHSLDEMRQRVWKYKKGAPQNRSDEIIGSILLQQPFFLSENDWIPIPDWPRSIVRGKGYDTVNEDGRRIWEQVQARLTKPIPVPDESVLVAEEKYGKPQICSAPPRPRGVPNDRCGFVSPQVCSLFFTHSPHFGCCAHPTLRNCWRYALSDKRHSSAPRHPYPF